MCHITERQEIELALEQTIEIGGAQNPIARELLKRWAKALIEEIVTVAELDEVHSASQAETPDVGWLYGLYRELTGAARP